MQNIKLGVTELESDKRAVFEFDKNTAKLVLEGCEQPILPTMLMVYIKYFIRQLIMLMMLLTLYGFQM